MREPFDFEAFSREVAERLKAGKQLVSQHGLFRPLLNRLVQASLEESWTTIYARQERQKRTAATAIS